MLSFNQEKCVLGRFRWLYGGCAGKSFTTKRSKPCLRVRTNAEVFFFCCLFVFLLVKGGAESGDHR